MVSVISTKKSVRFGCMPSVGLKVNVVK
uniref:Uncharacterized protein n=1 Tax=Nelumbo nucifera TaxID=4432 RepID=A0A822Z5H9_NELNU|nr:TPA_asm: hypothetical protein HUJ06_014655 [Nelumbo nucifera]